MPAPGTSAGPVTALAVAPGGVRTRVRHAPSPFRAALLVALALSTGARADALALARVPAETRGDVPAERTTSETRARPLCVYVSSYHRGYDWSDGVERGLRAALDGGCELVQFDMDTKRRRGSGEIEAAAAAANALIERLEPDIVITSDDIAAKHLVVPYLLDGPLPVVFSGVNWTVEEYGFPASNVTGIVEVAPIRPMIHEALALAPDATRAAYVGAATLTEQKNYERIAAAAAERGVTLDSVLAETFVAWKRAFTLAQSYDFVVIGSHSGIDDWEADEAAAHALAHTRRPSLTNHEWMMPVSAVGYTKLPDEHGERAGATALAILAGTRPSDIPLVVNRKWDTWLNARLAERLAMPVPERLTRRAKQAGPLP